MAGVTKKQIDDWKKEHGGVFLLPVEDKEAYLREPTMKDYKRAFAAMQAEGDIAFGEAMLNGLWLAGDEEVRQKDAYFLPARRVLTQMLDFDEAEVVENEDGTATIVMGGYSVNVRKITRDDLKLADKKNPAGKPFVTQEHLFKRICISDELPEVFADRNNAAVRMPLYAALEKLQNKKVATIKKL